MTTTLNGTSPILSPCHQARMIITTSMEGTGHMTTDVPDEILCSADGCYNSWSAKTGLAEPYNKA